MAGRSAKEKRKCPHCSRWFVPRNSQQKACSAKECQKAAKRLRDIERNQRPERKAVSRERKREYNKAEKTRAILNLKEDLKNVYERKRKPADHPQQQ